MRIVGCMEPGCGQMPPEKRDISPTHGARNCERIAARAGHARISRTAPTPMKRLFSFLLLASLFAPSLLMTSCASQPAQHEVHMAPLSELSPEIQSAPESVRTAYQFAVANPEPLKNVPCFCGCGAVGHKSNYDCYIKDAPANGKIVFDEHALGCSICVDITQDVLRMTRDGRAPPDIRPEIVNTYSRFGPSNQ